MDIVIDLTSITAFFSQPIDVILGKILFYFGWIPLAFTFLWGAFQVWLFYIRTRWAKENGKFVLLAIDIPRGNEQTPKAVENLLNYLAGGHGTMNLIEIYWIGVMQFCFSLEIVSLEGYTQFLIHTPAKFRNLVESAIYSQHPDAEITEVDDYAAKHRSLRFPDDEYDIWGTEFIQSTHKAYPIKTYKEFEHMIGPPGTQFKDPMASLMDLCSSLGKGEQLWYQIILRPIGFDWMDELDKEADRVLGEKVKSKKNIIATALDFLLGGISTISEAVLGMTTLTSGEAEKEADEPLKMLGLKPKPKRQIEAIHEKTSKMGFDFKVRMVYLAKKEVKQNAKVVNGFVGYMKQFAALDLNNLKPDLDRTGTSTAYFFRGKHLNYRKNRILQNYINRDVAAGRNPGLMNIEEIATIWHFPHEGVVKAPLIQKTAGKKAEAPMSLPRGGEVVSEERAEPIFLEEEELAREEGGQPDFEFQKEAGDVNKKGTPPGNLPIG